MGDSEDQQDLNPLIRLNTCYVGIEMIDEFAEQLKQQTKLNSFIVDGKTTKYSVYASKFPDLDPEIIEKFISLQNERQSSENMMQSFINARQSQSQNPKVLATIDEQIRYYQSEIARIDEQMNKIIHDVQIHQDLQSLSAEMTFKLPNFGEDELSDPKTLIPARTVEEVTDEDNNIHQKYLYDTVCFMKKGRLIEKTSDPKVVSELVEGTYRANIFKSPEAYGVSSGYKPIIKPDGSATFPILRFPTR